MKWLSVFAVALAAVLCVVPVTAEAQCANGVCQRISPVNQVTIQAAPAPVFYGTVQYAPQPVYEHAVISSCPGPRWNHSQPCNSQPAHYASVVSYQQPPIRPATYTSIAGQSRSGSVGVSLNWGRCANGRCSTNWR